MTEAEACRSCGSDLVPGAAFCRSCGTRVEHETTESPSPPPPASRQPAPPPPPPTDFTPRVAPAAPVALTPPEPAGSGGSRRRRIAIVAAAVVVVAVGGGAAAALLLNGGDESDSKPEAVAEQSVDSETSATSTTDTTASETTTTETSTDAGESPFASRVADGYPPQGNDAMNADIRAALLDFHQEIAKDKDRAWDLLSDAKREQVLSENTREEWWVAQQSVALYLDPRGLETKIEELEGDGVVRVDLDGMDWLKPGAPCEHWEGLSWVKYENEVWKYEPGFSVSDARRDEWEPKVDELLGSSC